MVVVFGVDGEYSQLVLVYMVWDIFVDYCFIKSVKFCLNVGNVFDKDYYFVVYCLGLFFYKGDVCNVCLIFNYEF